MFKKQTRLFAVHMKLFRDATSRFKRRSAVNFALNPGVRKTDLAVHQGSRLSSLWLAPRPWLA